MKAPRLRGGKAGLVLMPRIFAVIAAVLLVGSVGLAALLPGGISLRESISQLDTDALGQMQRVLVGALGHGFWQVIMLPILARPVWMLPTCLGVICIGGAVTALTHVSQRANHRQS